MRTWSRWFLWCSGFWRTSSHMTLAYHVRFLLSLLTLIVSAWCTLLLSSCSCGWYRGALLYWWKWLWKRGKDDVRPIGRAPIIIRWTAFFSGDWCAGTLIENYSDWNYTSSSPCKKICNTPRLISRIAKDFISTFVSSSIFATIRGLLNLLETCWMLHHPPTPVFWTQPLLLQYISLEWPPDIPQTTSRAFIIALSIVPWQSKAYWESGDRILLCDYWLSFRAPSPFSLECAPGIHRMTF